MTEFRYIGSHAEELEGGRPIEPGEFTGDIDPDLAKNKQLIDDELLLEVSKGTTQKVARNAERANLSDKDAKEDS